MRMLSLFAAVAAEKASPSMVVPVTCITTGVAMDESIESIRWSIRWKPFIGGYDLVRSYNLFINSDKL